MKSQWNLQYVEYYGNVQRHPDDTELHRSILQLFGGMYESFFQVRVWLLDLGCGVCDVGVDGWQAVRAGDRSAPAVPADLVD